MQLKSLFLVLVILTVPISALSHECNMQALVMTEELLVCLRDALKRSEALLDEANAQAVDGLNKETKEMFKKATQSWSDFRNKQCVFIATASIS